MQTSYMMIIGAASSDIVKASPVGVRSAEAARMMMSAHPLVRRMVPEVSSPSFTITMTTTGKVLYTGKTHTTGARESGIARSSDGHLDIKLERFALQDAITECQTQNLEAAIAAGVNLECDGNCAGIQVQADWRRLVQVLNNLISNAIKYNLPGGAVQIACSMPAPDRVVIAVTDTGPGLTQEQQAQLFQAFNRVGAEMGSIKGTGIGLSITRRFVEAMHGRITVDSVPGQGSTFRVEFPAARP